MPPIKPLDSISSKWARVSGQSAQSYEEGIKNPRADWKAQTTAANANYKASMQNALSNDSFGKGVSRSSTDNWQQQAIQKGVTRWPEGIRLSTDNYAKGFEPYRATIAALQLPPRGPKGSPGNITRVAKIAEALHNRKKQLMGQG